MKRIVIFGAGRMGEKAIRFFNSSSNIHIVAVCDNDSLKWNAEILGHIILPPEKVFSEFDFDSVLIAIYDYQEIYNWCIEKTSANVYKRISEMIAEEAYIDITSGCNAKCLYCVTGKTNRDNAGSIRFNYLSFEKFKEIYEHLISKDLITNETRLGLFNWGEPFLNNDFLKICEYLSDNKQKYILSTNASIFREAKKENTYSFCEYIYFSVPGFSQESYDRIHRFNFKTIKENIRKIYTNMCKNGFNGDGIISAHLYKFSIEETKELDKWAKSLGLKVGAYYPYLNGNSLFEKFLNKESDSEYIKSINEDLFVEKWIDLGKERPKQFDCPIGDWLVIDEKGEIVLCCQSDRYCSSYYGWGSILEVNSYNEYRKLKQKMMISESCIECKKLGIDYIVSNNKKLSVNNVNDIKKVF